MDLDSTNYLYIYDEKKHKIIIIDSETGERIDEKDDLVTSILKYLNNQNQTAELRKFAVWCTHQINKHIKPIQNKLLETAEQAIEGTIEMDTLKNLYEETEGSAVAIDTVGLRQGTENAPAFLASRECVNPDAYEGALQAARFHRLWIDIQARSSGSEATNPYLKEIRVKTSTDVVRQAEQSQIDYLLDLIGS